MPNQDFNSYKERKKQLNIHKNLLPLIKSFLKRSINSWINVHS